MFYVTAKIGIMYAIYDDTDNTVEWYNEVQLSKYLSMGVSITGYSQQGVSLSTDLTCPFESCNWTKSRNNIFKVADKVTLKGDILVIFSEHKKYKAKILKKTDTDYRVAFSNGLHVAIPRTWLEKYI